MPGKNFQIRSAPEQLADHLREEIHSGRLFGEMPGVNALASEFGVHQSTAEECMRRLEREGLIQSQGVGRRRMIEPQRPARARGARFGLLLSSPDDAGWTLVGRLQHRLREAGHQVVIASKTMGELRFKVQRVARMVEGTPADGWVVLAGSHEILEWFSAQGPPTFALFGAPGSLPLAHAGPTKDHAVREIVRRLTEGGHRRICVLADERLRKPELVGPIRCFVEELQAHGIPAGPYNLPDWSAGPESLWKCLESLFRISRPTALIIDEAEMVPGVLQFLGQRKLSAPDHISLACLDEAPFFNWMNPGMAHLVMDSQPWIRRAVRWGENVAAGVEDHRKAISKAKFVEGGTMGPAPGGTAKV